MPHQSFSIIYTHASLLPPVQVQVIVLILTPLLVHPQDSHLWVFLSMVGTEAEVRKRTTLITGKPEETRISFPIEYVP